MHGHMKVKIQPLCINVGSSDLHMVNHCYSTTVLKGNVQRRYNELQCTVVRTE